VIERQLAVRWARATWIGWLLAIPIVIALAFLGEAVGVGGAQFLVGLGAGIGVGVGQRRIVRDLLGLAGPWFWSSAIGLALPFLVFDATRLAGSPLPYSLPAMIAVGGLIAGVWQAQLLRARFGGAALWVLASAAGWSLAAAAAFAAELLFQSLRMRGVWGALAYLGTIGGGGLLLGITTGLCLGWLSRQTDGRGRL